MSTAAGGGLPAASLLLAAASAVDEEESFAGDEAALTSGEAAEEGVVVEKESVWPARLVEMGIGGDWELEMRRNVTNMSKRKKANTKGYFLSFKMLGTDNAAMEIYQRFFSLIMDLD